MPFKYQKISTVNAMIPLIESMNVSAIARSKRGFLRAYKRLKTPAKMKLTQAPGSLQSWDQKRNAFLKRQIAQAKSNGESWWVDGLPTRRHLALIAWAYTPTPSRLQKYLRGWNDYRAIFPTCRACAHSHFLLCGLVGASYAAFRGYAGIDSCPGKC